MALRVGMGVQIGDEEEDEEEEMDGKDVGKAPEKLSQGVKKKKNYD